MIELNWCLPVSGDGDQLGLPTWSRPPSLDYAVEVSNNAAAWGFRHLLVGMGFNNHVHEAWTLATAVLARTTLPSMLVAVRPGFFSAPVMAKMVSTLDHLSQGRLALNVVTGGRRAEQAMYGDALDHDTRYRRTAEFIDVCRRLWASNVPFDYGGEFYKLRQTQLELLPLQSGGPSIYFGGASPAAEIVGAQHADVHLFWGETLAQTKERVTKMKLLVAQAGRASRVRFGLRINIIARDTEAAARDAAKHLIAPVGQKRIHKALTRDLEATERDSVGQRRQWDLLSASAERDWFVEPLLWSGVSLVRSGAGMALVGSYDQVADRLSEYARMGIDVFILSGYPHLEEAENVGKNVVPRVLANVAARTSRDA
ncbi:MAG: LLM class flavin-dependent oxidoreductase [Polyangiaceae bacterium]